MMAHACQKCAELEEQLAWFRAELEGREPDVIRLMDVLHLRKAECHLLLRLYAGRGRMVSHQQLLEANPSDRDDRSAEGVKVKVYNIRRSQLGESAIESVWGYGYRLSKLAVSTLSAILAGQSLS